MPVRTNYMIASAMRATLRGSIPSLVRRMDAVADGRATPSIESMTIGSGRKVTAAVVFFDICGFTQLTNSDDPETLKRTLLLLNCVIPAMMRVLYRYGAYVEKNTGDGLMAVLGVETNDRVTANHALEIAEEMFFVLQAIVNPELVKLGLQPIRARIGIDMGQILISRIGVPNGTSAHERNSLTAVGPAANRACKIQGLAGVNEVWVGDSIYRNALNEKIPFFNCVTPATWNWTYGNSPQHRYHCWHYQGRVDPLATHLTGPTQLIL